MACRVGIDLVSVEAVSESVSRFGARYLDRVYTADELAASRTGGEFSMLGLARRFALKEATFKALGADREDAVPWPEIEISSLKAGSSRIELRGQAGRIGERAGLVSLSHGISDHGRRRALAIVIAELSSDADIDPSST